MQAVATRDKQFTPSHRKNIPERAQTQQPRNIGISNERKEANVTSLPNRLFTLSFNPIGSIRAYQNIGYAKGVKSHIKGLLANCLPFIGSIPEDLDADGLGVLLHQTLTGIAKKVGCQYRIEVAKYDDAPDKRFIVFYRSCNSPHCWYAPKLAFLHKLEKENREWYSASLDAIRWITISFDLSPAHTDWGIEYLKETLKSGEAELEQEERKALFILLRKYNRGRISKLFKLIGEQPKTCLTELIGKITNLSEMPFKKQLLDLLNLCYNPKNIAMYDYSPMREYLNDRDDDSDYLQLGDQYAWIYDENTVTDDCVEYVTCIANEVGVIHPHTFYFLKKNNVKNLSAGEVIANIKAAVVEDLFPDKFSEAMNDLCFTIEQYL